MPKNLKANAMPTDGYGMEVDGKMKSYYATAEAAAKVCSELKQKFPQLQVKVFDVKQRTHTVVDLAEAR
jgi:hypothetical protein